MLCNTSDGLMMLQSKTLKKEQEREEEIGDSAD